MIEYETVMYILLIGLGIYLTYLINKLSHLKEQLQNHNSLILSMATELKELGSPNVEIIIEDDDEK